MHNICCICNSLYVSRFCLKRQKSDCVDSVDGEKDEDLTLLTFQNHKKPKNVQFFQSAYVYGFFDNNPKLRQAVAVVH